ncbi:MAG: FAD-dependent oxidoreductase [Spirochaetes bacterium]|jgi:NAD(P)H-nitrite reductase large subunit|nr:FAD-dependent oxidoreductase [Spirochaetota bacterium]
MGSNRILVIGASAAGISAVKEIRSINQGVDITMITDEKYNPYYRPYLTEFIGNNRVLEKPNFFLNPDKWFAENRIGLVLGRRVTEINQPGKYLLDEKGEKHEYGKLILACGSRPFVPISGALEKKNVFSVRTLDDAKRTSQYATGIKKAIIIGGGLLGLETANSLMGLGVSVTVVELSDRILPVQLDAECSSIMEGILKKAGTDLVLCESVDSISGGEVATGVILKSGREIGTDMIIFSIGVRSNIDLAKNSGIKTNRAILVNERMETSEPDIYACGDAAEFMGKTIALWMPAVKQGKVAGSNAAGRTASFEQEEYPAVLNAFGTRLYSIGNKCLDEDEDRVKIIRKSDEAKGDFKKLFFLEEILVGAILIGNISDGQKISVGIKGRMKHNDILKMLDLQ